MKDALLNGALVNGILMEREAKLFEAGSYPDRGVEITEEELDAIAANTGEVPIRVEHTSTPFDGAIGFLKSVYRKGSELFGRLCFTRPAWELIKAADAKRLSVAIKKDKSGIAEVSLVREPRVADAAVFGAADAAVFSEDDAIHIAQAELALDAEFSSAADPKIAALEAEIARKNADARIDELKRAGKLAPAAEEFARAILTSADSNLITFAGEEVCVSDVFVKFLNAQPKVIEFSELAKAGENSAEEPEIFARLGVTSEQVEKHRNR